MNTELKNSQPVLVSELFPHLLRELVALLRELGEGEWQRPSARPGWMVKDVALHLLWGEIGNLSRRTDGHSLEANVAGWDELVAIINDWNEKWVDAARRISVPLLIDLLEFAGA